MKQKGAGDNPWRAAGLVGAMGINVTVCILLGYFLGSRLGGTAVWTVGGICLGLVAGIWTCVLLLKRVLEDADE